MFDKTITQDITLPEKIRDWEQWLTVRFFYTGEKIAMELYLYEDLLKAQNQGDLLEKTQRAVEKLEYETFIYGFRYLDTSGRESKITDHIFGTYPESLRKRYIEMDYESLDPTIQHCMTRATPIIWTHDCFSAPKVIDMHHECVDAGVAGGATFPVRGNWLGGAGLFSLARAEDTDKSVPHTIETLGNGLLLAGYVHEAVRRIGFADLAKNAPAVTLTSRERECLLHAAHGRTKATIAKMLFIDYNTVVFHLTKAYQKIGAANCTEAVAIAISRGLIQP